MNLDELEKICNEATPEPWEYTSGDEQDDWTLHNPETSEYIKQDDSGVPIADKDGEFIAAARNHMPKLIKIARAAEKQLKATNDFLSKIEGKRNE